MSLRLRRLTGRLLLVVFAATFGVSTGAGHLTGEDDALCAGLESGAEGSASVAPPETGTVARSHCAICHWTRAVAGAESQRPVPTSHGGADARTHSTLAAPDLPDAVLPPSSPRAPPSSLLS